MKQALKPPALIIIATVLFAVGFLLGKYAEGNKNQQPSVTEKIGVQTGLDKYLPLAKNSFWEYKGTKREQEANGIEQTDIQKRIEITDIKTSDEETIVLLTDGNSWTIKGNTIDFEPKNDSDMKFTPTFPLYVGQKWGGTEDSLRFRDDGFYVWEVEEKLSKEVLGKNYDECFKITFKELADTTYKVFCYGLGVVEEGYKHNGTFLEWNYDLVAN